jgi:hypothetical protein
MIFHWNEHSLHSCKYWQGNHAWGHLQSWIHLISFSRRSGYGKGLASLPS